LFIAARRERSVEVKAGGTNYLQRSKADDCGMLHRERGEYDEAENVLTKALAGRKIKLSPDHPHTLKSARKLAVLYMRGGRYDVTERLLLETFHGCGTKVGSEHPHTLESLRELVRLYESHPKPDEAEEYGALPHLLNGPQPVGNAGAED
jgi:hypothetical protein